MSDHFTRKNIQICLKLQFVVDYEQKVENC